MRNLRHPDFAPNLGQMPLEADLHEQVQQCYKPHKYRRFLAHTIRNFTPTTAVLDGILGYRLQVTGHRLQEASY